MSRVCLWTFAVLLATTQRVVVFASSQAFIVDTPNGTVHVDPSGRTAPTAGNPVDQHWISQIKSFPGNTTHPDDFKLLLQDGDHMIVGARNTAYNISLVTLTSVKKLTWPSTRLDVTVCRAKRKTEEQCQNYIHVAVKLSPSELLLCGTNSFKPLCRTYHNEPEKDYYHVSERDGIGKCPYDPHHNSTAIHVDGELYSATVGDFSAGDALIYKYPMRTEQHDSQWLNDPDFVHTLAYGDKVYIFFRETAVEHINCGKSVFSRVARICKNDKGGAQLLRNVWTSFFKARLNCSIPGEFPFYFNELQSTTDVGQGNYMPALEYDNRTDMVYAVFNTPSNSIKGSAVCAFRFSDILQTFEGQFKTQDSSHSNWLPVHESDTPKPHPAKQCANDSRRISDQTLNFIKSHPLMDGAVPAFGGQPILLQTSFKYRLTTVAIDWHVSAANQRYYDILWVGTDDGRVIKAINKGRTGKIETEILRTYKVFSNGAPVTSLSVYRNNQIGQEKLIVISKDEIKSIPLYDCNPDYTCSQCVQLQDPYCSFYKGACGTSRKGFQNIERGTHSGCPVDEPSTTLETAATTSTINTTTTASPPVVTCPVCVCTPPPSLVAPSSGQSAGSSPPTVNPDQQHNAVTRDIPDTTNIDNRIPQIPQVAGSLAHNSQGYIYKASDMAIATVLCIVISLVLGSFVGYHISLWRHPRDNCAHLKQPTICTNQLEIKESGSQIDHYSPMPRAKHTNVILDTKMNGFPRTKLDSNSRQEYV